MPMPRRIRRVAQPPDDGGVLDPEVADPVAAGASVVEIFVNTVLRREAMELEPAPNAVASTTAINPAMIPYSMAVAPRSSRMNLKKAAFMMILKQFD
jgi:hypothetical protein